MAAAAETTPPLRPAPQRPVTSEATAAKSTPTSPPISPSGDRPFNVYVKNFTAEIDDKKLHSMFEAFGTIQSCTVLHDHHGYSKLVGFVQFSSDEEAKKAVQEMHNKTGLGNKPLHVALTNKKPVNNRRHSGLNYYAFDYTPLRQPLYGAFPMSSPNSSPTPPQTHGSSHSQSYGSWASPGPLQVIYVPYNPYEYGRPATRPGQYTSGAKGSAQKPGYRPASSGLYTGPSHEQYMPHYVYPASPVQDSYHGFSASPFAGYNAGWGTPYCHPYGHHHTAQSMGYAYA